MSLNPKTQISLTIIAAIILIIGIGVALIEPLRKNIVDLSQQTERQQIMLEITYTQTINSLKSKEKYFEIEKDLEELNRAFINQDNTLDFITALENVASNNQVAQEFQLGNKEETKKNINILPLQSSIRGNYINILNYLADIESLDYYVDIQSLSFITSQKGESQSGIEEIQTLESGNVNLNILAKTYWK